MRDWACDMRGSGEICTVRRVLCTMLEEYARSRGG
ncbi:hypothetical protein GPDM_07285, partial [Planococcus donghaensis MPA1U2]